MRNRGARLLAPLLVWLVFPNLVAVEHPGAAAPGAGVDMQWGVKIPMRDGVSLNATVYSPRERKEPLPVVFTLTPYISDSYLDRAFYFAEHGYVFAARGRPRSRELRWRLRAVRVRREGRP